MLVSECVLRTSQERSGQGRVREKSRNNCTSSTHFSILIRMLKEEWFNFFLSGARIFIKKRLLCYCFEARVLFEPLNFIFSSFNKKVVDSLFFFLDSYAAKKTCCWTREEGPTDQWF